MCPNVSCAFVQSFQYHMEHVGGVHTLTENTGRQKQSNLHFGNVATDNQTRGEKTKK